MFKKEGFWNTLTVKRPGVIQEIEWNGDKDAEFKKEISLALLALGESQSKPLINLVKDQKDKRSSAEEG